MKKLVLLSLLSLSMPAYAAQDLESNKLPKVFCSYSWDTDINKKIEEWLANAEISKREVSYSQPAMSIYNDTLVICVTVSPKKR